MADASGIGRQQYQNARGGRFNQRNNNFRGRHHGGRNFRTNGRTSGRGRFHHHNYQRNQKNTYNFNNNTELQVNNDIVNVEEIGTYDTDGNYSSIRIAIQGCAHGNLDRIYETLELLQKRDEKPIDLLLCCGDFQSIRNVTDLDTMAVPIKYREMGTFHNYYAGLKVAPILTIFVGGNHEASSYLSELYYGGWVARNIYYLGAAGVVRFKGLRIAGVSGIYKSHDYNMGRYETPPYDNSTLRSVYHVRNVEIARMKCLQQLSKNDANSPIVDIMLTHDWPRGIEQHGDTRGLLRKKKFFEQEVLENTLGNPAHEELLHLLKPKWWFAAHLHVKFQASYRHDTVASTHSQTLNNTTVLIPSQVIKSSGEKTQEDSKSVQLNETTFLSMESTSQQCTGLGPSTDLTELMTKFLSLDKCLPRRHYLQVINIPQEVTHHDTQKVSQPNTLHYDLEWLAILQKTHNWTIPSKSHITNPDTSSITIDEGDVNNIRNKLTEYWAEFHPDMAIDDPTTIPDNFVITLPPHGAVGSDIAINNGKMVGNPQTDRILNILDLNHIITVPYILDSKETNTNYRDLNADVNSYLTSQNKEDENQIDLDDDYTDAKADVNSYLTSQNKEDENQIDLDDDDTDAKADVNLSYLTSQNKEDENQIDLEDD